MSSDKENPGNPGRFVSQRQCSAQFGKVDLALFGKDGRGGMVKDLSDIKHQVSETSKEVSTFLKNHKTEEKEKGRDWRLLGFAVLGSVVSGVVVSTVAFYLLKALGV